MAKTRAQIQADYRARKQAAGLKQVLTWQSKNGEPVKPPPPISADSQWQAELKKEKLAAMRKEGRRLARRQDRAAEHGRIAGVCAAAAYFCGGKIDRADIARALLSHFMLDRDTAAAALESDKRTKDLTLALLDRYSAWAEPPQ